MRIISRALNSLIPQDPNNYNDFGRWSNDAADFDFIPHSWFDDESVLKESVGRNVSYIEFEEPNRFFMLERGDFTPNKHDSYREHYQKIFTICPFTTEWLNTKYKNTQRVQVFQPFNEKFIPAKATKEFDVIYAGHIVSKEVDEAVDAMTQFNYKFVSNSDDARVTDKGVSYEEKLKLLAKTKISVVHNLLFPKYSHVESVWNIPDYESNAAFKLFPKKLPRFIPLFLRQRLIARKRVIVPQIKQRLFEAAFCRSLILCRKDPFNVIEKFFEPGKEFVYYEPSKLAEKIEEILTNFETYRPIIDRAYERAVREYTTKAFFEKYLKTLQ